MLSKSSALRTGSCVLAIRVAKIGCIAAIGFYVALVAFGNITDYWTNFAFVTNVLDMDESLPCLHSLARGDVPHPSPCRLYFDHRDRDRHRGTLYTRRCCDGSAAPGQDTALQDAKNKAVAGLTLGFLLYEGGSWLWAANGSACGRRGY